MEVIANVCIVISMIQTVSNVIVVVVQLVLSVTPNGEILVSTLVDILSVDLNLLNLFTKCKS